jgi:hypothetical protein
LQKRKGIPVHTQTKKQLADLVRSAKAERKQLLEQVKFLDSIIEMSGEEKTYHAKPSTSRTHSKEGKKKRAWSAAAKRRAKERCNSPEMKKKYSQAQRARRARERLHQSQSSLSI